MIMARFDIRKDLECPFCNQRRIVESVKSSEIDGMTFWDCKSCNITLGPLQSKTLLLVFLTICSSVTMLSLVFVLNWLLLVLNIDPFRMNIPVVWNRIALFGLALGGLATALCIVEWRRPRPIRVQPIDNLNTPSTHGS
jgi:hypothetical protein